MYVETQSRDMICSHQFSFFFVFFFVFFCQGYVRLQTNHGDLNLELHCEMVRCANILNFLDYLID